MRRSILFAAALVSACLGSVGFAAGQQTYAASAGEYTPQRPFLLVEGTANLTEQGDWRQLPRLRSYAKSHPGSYILFLNGNDLALLEDPATLAEAKRLAEPVHELAAEQGRLAALQAPLAAKQQELARQMKTAVGPEGMAKVGAEQGKVGQEQGRIGAEQGRIGQKQGAAGVALYNKVESAIESCLAAKSCRQAP